MLGVFMKAILTVIGKDKVGIIAGVSQCLATEAINILDVSQTIMDDYFTMMMMIDVSHADSDFSQIQTSLTELGKTLGVKISVQREDIFNTMHKL